MIAVTTRSRALISFPSIPTPNPTFYLFVFYCDADHGDLHSFPTRRSSDLERPLAHDVVFRVEQLVDRLEAEVGHPDEVGVRKHQRHPQLAAVRLADVADLLRQEFQGAFALLPVLHQVSTERNDSRDRARR